METGREKLMETRKYVLLNDLEVYQLARKLSGLAWEIYEMLDWRDRKVMGDQFLTATDSIGANIAEGYGRFHFLDKIRFFYNARASFMEAHDHWLGLLRERSKIKDIVYKQFNAIAEKFSIKLQNFITATHNARQRESQR